ncbi:MAG: sigma-70 family RNA polymerase sigma factor [Nitrospirae bacterium]|nr:sigma-70 family RNA polymerase sigma factor [Nitrospirota bacterium]
MPLQLNQEETVTQADDRGFFEEKVIGLLDQLFGAAMRLVKNREDAEDLVAEAVTKAWASRRSLKDTENFRPWIFRILTNTFISDCRKRAVRPQTETLSENPSDAETAFSLFEELHQPFLLWWGNPEKEFLNKLLREDLAKAVDALPDLFRIVVVLSDLEGFSYQEMAGILKVPVGTVRSRLARGRGLLQKALWRHAKEAGLIKESKKSSERFYEKDKNDRL